MPIADGADALVVEAAAAALAAGELLGLPTETVYGLAADADNATAVAAIFDTKGRPRGHPLIVHIAGHTGRAAIDTYATGVPAFALRLADAFWPGPLTLILPRRADAAAVAAGGHATIGLRAPAHPVAQALLAAAARHGVRGIAAPSANRFGRVSPTTAQHVAGEFPDLRVLDGGPCAVGIESTIVDCTRGQPVLLRPGAITREQVAAAAGLPLVEPGDAAGPAPQASGTLEAHYAPRATVRLMDARSLQAALDVLGDDAAPIAVYARAPLRSRSRSIVLARMPADAAAAAHELFATLRRLDAPGTRLIWVEAPPAEPAWEGVADRLRRAAAAG